MNPGVVVDCVARWKGKGERKDSPKIRICATARVTSYAGGRIECQSWPVYGGSEGKKEERNMCVLDGCVSFTWSNKRVLVRR